MGSYAKKLSFGPVPFNQVVKEAQGREAPLFLCQLLECSKAKQTQIANHLQLIGSRTEKGNIFGRNKKAPIRNQSLPGAKEVQVQEEGIKPSAATGHKNRFQMLNCYDVTAACSGRNTILLQERHLYACCFVTKHHFQQTCVSLLPFGQKPLAPHQLNHNIGMQLPKNHGIPQLV